jgi:hypothetical protein
MNYLGFLCMQWLYLSCIKKYQVNPNFFILSKPWYEEMIRGGILKNKNTLIKLILCLYVFNHWCVHKNIYQKVQKY